jgi:hypothetical protein
MLGFFWSWSKHTHYSRKLFYSLPTLTATRQTHNIRGIAHCGQATNYQHYHSLTKIHLAPYPTRTHTCGALTTTDVGSRVVLAGWLLPGR